MNVPVCFGEFPHRYPNAVAELDCASCIANDPCRGQTPAHTKLQERRRVEQDPTGRKPSDPGAKLDQGKPLAAVLMDFSHALQQVVAVGTYGANKYSRGGWVSVPDGEQRYLDAAWRHLLAAKPEGSDPDTHLDHLAHAAWNLLAVLELRHKS
jgi:hypothetical protein